MPELSIADKLRAVMEKDTKRIESLVEDLVQESTEIEELKGQIAKLKEFIQEFLERVPLCTCAEYYKPYYPRTDPQCPLHGHFDFSEEEIEEIRELVEVGDE